MYKFKTYDSRKIYKCSNCSHAGFLPEHIEKNRKNFVPEIVDIYDIPNAQGGHVYIQFNGSYFDKPDIPNQVYGVMRYDDVSEDSSAWVAVMSFPAIGEDQYIFDVSTLADSTIEDNAMTQIKVVASMSGGKFHSDPSEG